MKTLIFITNQSSNKQDSSSDISRKRTNRVLLTEELLSVPLEYILKCLGVFHTFDQLCIKLRLGHTEKLKSLVRYILFITQSVTPADIINLLLSYLAGVLTALL